MDVNVKNLVGNVEEYLALRHEGAPERTRAEFALAWRVVREWFPVRALALEAAFAARVGDIDATSSLALAEPLGVALVTKNHEVTSKRVPILLC